MKPPKYVRPLLEGEARELRAGPHSRDAFTLRRSQILLASAAGHKPSVIAKYIGCTPGTVVNAINAFGAEGLLCLKAKPDSPREPAHIWSRQNDEKLRSLLHQSPRTFGKTTSIWTLDLVAEVCYERGLTARQLSGEAIRVNLKRLKIGWERAKHWMTSPDPDYVSKKARRDRLVRLAAQHPDWVLGFEDEVWWSRLARPSLSTWTDGDPQKIQLLMQDNDDPDPDAIACYGILRSDTHKVMVRFVEDRPLADVTIQFVDWFCRVVSEEGKKVLIVVWDDASWHTAEVIPQWVVEHNSRAKRRGRARIVICELPVASPWLNNIEPCFRHAKKNILEPSRKLTSQETTERVCEHFECEMLPYLKSAVAPEPQSSECDCGGL
jgi:transposase